MSSLPPHIVQRRGRRREQLRRRRIAVRAMVAAVVTGLVVLGVALASSSNRSPRAGSSAPPPAGSRRSAGGQTRGGPGRVAAAREAADRRGAAEISRLIALGLPTYCGGRSGNAVAFTFDDGPGPYTYLALRKLRQAHERATFFVVGKSMNSYPGYLSRELKVAAIGDHTYTHPFLPALSPAAITDELGRTKQQIESLSGRPADLFRPPYGSHTPVVDQTARRLRLLEILWTVDSADSLGANYAGIIRNVEAGLRPGAIILMHENRGQTIRALTTLLPELHRRHLRSVSLPELFATDPPTVAQVRAGPHGCGLSAGSGSRTGS